MDVQVVVYFALNEVAHVFVNAFSARTHCERAQLNLSLAFEHRLLHVDGNCCHHAVANVYVLVVFGEKVFNGFGDVFLKGTLVRTTLRGMLSVNERIILFAVLVGVGKGNFNVFALNVDDGVEPIVGHAVVQQVGQAIATNDAPTVVHDGQTSVKVGVIAEHCLHKLCFKAIIKKQSVVGFEEYERAVFFVGALGVVAN